MEWWIIGGILFQAIVCAFFSYILAAEKGYSGKAYAVAGFLFSILGLLVAAGLPLSPEETQRRFQFLNTPPITEDLSTHSSFEIKPENGTSIKF